MNATKDSPKTRRRLRKIVITLATLVLLITGIAAWLLFRPNVPGHLEDEFVIIPTGSTLNDVVRILKNGGYIRDRNTFRLMAYRMEYKGRPGRYKIEPGWSNVSLVRHLRRGKQAPVKVVLHNERLPENVAAKVARFLEPDSLAFITVFNDPVILDSLGYSPQTLMTLFIPNTYEFFWNTSPRKFMERMIAENGKFWEKDDRQAKADSLGLTKEEVYTLASIIEKETNENSEKRRMAGVYLNRLHLGMPLQADPTLVFASRDWDSRDLAPYKSLDSPYNTYMYPGLPPGPIAMASIPSIEAVLDAEEHNYIFFVSIGDGSGLHMFSETYEAHLVNIKKYKENLLKRNLGL